MITHPPQPDPSGVPHRPARVRLWDRHPAWRIYLVTWTAVMATFSVMAYLGGGWVMVLAGAVAVTVTWWTALKPPRRKS